jgi:branched-chain amino acid transport system ATP-binding protein
VLEIHHLCVNYDHIEALCDVSFSIPKGKIISIIGSNGAGKTSLLNAISSVVKIKSGTIELNGAPLPLKPHEVVRKGIIQVPEGRKVFVGLSVQENLVMGGCRGTATAARKKMPEMYALFPILDTRKNQLAGTLSGGEQQMLAIARGLMANPDILLLDEPSLGLAPLIVSQVFELIQKINQMGITILLVEQNAHKALSISDYTYVLENGKIKMEGKSSELLGNSDIRKAYLGK